MKDYQKTIELCQWAIDRNQEENLGADFPARIKNDFRFFSYPLPSPGEGCVEDAQQC